jgi:hypothetical protein
MNSGYKMNMQLHKHIRLALFYFLLAALLGAALRLFVQIDFPAEYRFLVHTHSHIALLGWVYVALTTLLYKFYLAPAGVSKPYRRIFIFTQITLVGMLLTFPIQGYALFSIIFSTLFLIASYFFAGLFLKSALPEMRQRFSFKLSKWAVIYMVLSSIGPWTLGAIMNTLGSTSIWYKLSVYFYLHFQYNGWFVLALLGILFFFLEENGFELEQYKHQLWLRLFNSSVLLTFFLSTLFAEPHYAFYLLGGLGALLQTLILVLLFFWLLPRWHEFKSHLKKGVGTMLLMAGILLGIKSDLQLLSAIPYFARLAFQNIDFVIAYLHLVFLGAVTLALFAVLVQAGLLKLSQKLYWMYLIAFLLTEALIIYKGFCIWQRIPLFENYYLILSIGSLLFPVVLLMVLFNNSFQKNINSP